MPKCPPVRRNLISLLSGCVCVSVFVCQCWDENDVNAFYSHIEVSQCFHIKELNCYYRLTSCNKIRDGVVG